MQYVDSHFIIGSPLWLIVPVLIILFLVLGIVMYRLKKKS